MTGQQYVILSPSEQLAALQEAASKLPQTRRRPVSTERADYEAALDDRAEARKVEREYATGRESDVAAGRDEDRRQRTNDRLAS